MTTNKFTVERVRHPLKFRLLTVLHTQLLTPHLLSVTLTGDDLDDFVSASFDDHVKLFFPLPGESEPVLPDLPGAAPRAEGAPEAITRDFTPRRYNREARELELQFSLHGTGPASAWARQAEPGDKLGVGGPRGSFLIPVGFDWFLMAGDASAMPAIARRLEELPAGTRVTVLLAIDAVDERIEFVTQAKAEIVWLDRSADPEALEQAVAAWSTPSGEGYVWAAGEAAAMRAIHADVVGKRGLAKDRVRAAAYWKKGAIAVHETMGVE